MGGNDLYSLNAHFRVWLGTVGWFVQLLGGCFHQESDIPLFHHLTVLDYKPSYSQEPWLGIPQSLSNLGCILSHV